MSKYVLGLEKKSYRKLTDLLHHQPPNQDGNSELNRRLVANSVSKIVREKILHISAGYGSKVTLWNARKEILGNVNEVFVAQIEGEPSPGAASLNVCRAVQNAAGGGCSAPLPVTCLDLALRQR